MRAAGLPDKRPLPEQLAEASADAAEFAGKLRYMATMRSASDPQFERFADAIGVVAGELEAAAVRLATDDGGPVTPGSGSLTELCALLLTTVWVRGRQGFTQALDTIEASARTEGKR